eukprot:1792093-Pyramimonas_sp.AAC.1
MHNIVLKAYQFISMVWWGRTEEALVGVGAGARPPVRHAAREPPPVIVRAQRHRLEDALLAPAGDHVRVARLHRHLAPAVLLRVVGDHLAQFVGLTRTCGMSSRISCQLAQYSSA